MRFAPFPRKEDFARDKEGIGENCGEEGTLRLQNRLMTDIAA